MKKKKIAVLLGVITLVSSLAGCSTQKPDTDSQLSSKEPVTIKIATYYNGAIQLAFENLVKEFNTTVGTEKGIYVEVTSTGDMNELNDQVFYESQRGGEESEMPDIFLAYGNMAQRLDKAGVVLHLDKYFTDGELNEYVSAYIEEGKVGEDQALVLFPVAKSVEVMAYNVTDWETFSKDTNVTEEDLSTWEGLAAVSEQYYNWTDQQTNTPDDGKAFFGRDAFANYMIVGLHQLGTELITADQEDTTIHLSKSSMRKLWDNYYVPFVSGYYGQYGRYRSDDMKTGNILSLVGASSGAAFLPVEVTADEDEPYEIQVKQRAIPNFEGCDPAVIQQGAGMVVAKTNEKAQQACIQFIKWFTEEENNTRFAIASSYLPVKTAANSLEYIEEVASKYDLELSNSVKSSLEISFKEAEEYELYSMEVFEESDACRSILGDTMISRALADYEAIQNSIKAGRDREMAIGDYVTEDNFQDWYNKTVDELSKVVTVSEEE